MPYDEQHQHVQARAACPKAQYIPCVQAAVREGPVNHVGDRLHRRGDRFIHRESLAFDRVVQLVAPRAHRQQRDRLALLPAKSQQRAVVTQPPVIPQQHPAHPHARRPGDLLQRILILVQVVEIGRRFDRDAERLSHQRTRGDQRLLRIDADQNGQRLVIPGGRQPGEGRLHFQFVVGRLLLNQTAGGRLVKLDVEMDDVEQQAVKTVQR